MAIFFDDLARISAFRRIPSKDMPVALSVYSSRKDAVAGYVEGG